MNKSLVREGAPAELGPREFSAALVGLLGLALAIRLSHLDSSAYDVDEILQTYFVQGPWSFFWGKVKFDAVHPPLDYLITRSVEALHPADWTRRLPAVLWGVGTIAVVATLVRRRAGSRAGIVVAMLLALAPFHVRYSQELRPYSLGLFCLCGSLLALDRYLERPGVLRLLGVYLAALATAYTLYLAAVALGIAAFALLVSDSSSSNAQMRLRARRALAWSPLFLVALFLAYLPWAPVLLTALERPAVADAPPIGIDRLGKLLSFFSFAPGEGHPLRIEGALYVTFVGVGLFLAFRSQRLRFFAIWLVGTWAAIELLEVWHSHGGGPRYFLVGGIVLPVLAALSLAAILRNRRARWVGIFLVALFAVTGLRSLTLYFREGRPDWRLLGNALKARSGDEVIFTNNEHTELCLGFYVVGPQFLLQRGHTTPRFVPLDENPLPIAWVWKPETTAWLVIAGGGSQYPGWQEWAGLFPGIEYPRAEGAILRRLDPSLWGRMAATIPRLPG